MAKNPMALDRVTLLNGGVIETEAGTDIIAVSTAGVVTVSSSSEVIVDLTTSGDTTLGDSSADTLTVPSTSVFEAPVDFQSTVTTSAGLFTAAAGMVTETSLTIRDFLIFDASTRSGPGAIPQTNPAVNLTTTGADALTLANGTVDNEILTITMIVDGGDGTLTPATPFGYSTITFGAVGDSVILRWIPTLGWAILGFNGVVIA